MLWKATDLDKLESRSGGRSATGGAPGFWRGVSPPEFSSGSTARRAQLNWPFALSETCCSPRACYFATRFSRRQQYIAHLLVAERLNRSSQPGRFGRTQIPAHRLWIQAHLGNNPFLRHLLLPEPKDFPELDHRDLAIHPRLLPGLGQSSRRLPHGQMGGRFCKSSLGKGERFRKNPQEGVPTFRKPTHYPPLWSTPRRRELQQFVLSSRANEDTAGRHRTALISKAGEAAKKLGQNPRSSFAPVSLSPLSGCFLASRLLQTTAAFQARDKRYSRPGLSRKRLFRRLRPNRAFRRRNRLRASLIPGRFSRHEASA
jgi:hypothetical protein